MDIQNLLKVREAIKSRKPEFVRQDFNKKARLRRRWKRPKGVHSKIRHNVKGKPRPVAQGYRSPVKIRGFHKSGLMVKVIASAKELDLLDKNKHGIIISSNVGNKKRVVIIKSSLQLGFNLLNIKNPQELVSKIEEKFASKKKIQKKEEPKQEKKEPKSENVESEEIKETEKKEKERVLTKRER